jgi:integral membrane protein
VLGLVHGVIYLGYAAVVLAAARRHHWAAQHTVTLLFVAAIPLGGFWVARHAAGDGDVAAVPGAG